MGAIIEPLVKEDFIKDKSTKPTGKGPAILLNDKRGKDDKPSDRNKGRDSQKRRRNKP